MILGLEELVLLIVVVLAVVVLGGLGLGTVLRWLRPRRRDRD